MGNIKSTITKKNVRRALHVLRTDPSNPDIYIYIYI